MKMRLLTFLLVVPFVLSSQTHKTKRHVKPAAVRPGMQQYYAAHQLVPDSACNPYLYYQVYDWLGTRYKFAGETKKGIDCSRFVSQMYKNTYCIDLAGGSRDIWTTVKPLEKEELQEGDLLFFKIKHGQISHIGIYLGNNKFAHASVRSGVTVSDLDEDYYRKYFFKGGRIQ